MIGRYLDFLIITESIILTLERLTNGEILITGYPGSSNQREFYVYTHPLSWREASIVCKEENLWMMGTWYDGNSYVKSVALYEGWMYESFWIGYVHHAGKSDYHKLYNCDDDVPESRKHIINGYDITVRQCLYVNMSSPNTDDTNIFAGPCEREMPYLCMDLLGHYSGDPNATVRNKDKKFKTETDVQSFAVADMVSCIDKLFERFLNYAAEFDSSTQSCRVKMAAKASELPIVFEVVSSTDGKIVLHKTSQSVEFRSTVKNVPSFDWPCLSEPTVTASVSEKNLLTSDVDHYSTSLSLRKSTSYIGITNASCCICRSNENKEELGPLTLIDKRSLSRFKMQKISAPDSRVSAATIGWIGAVTLVTIFCVIISADIHSVFTKTKWKTHDKRKRK